MSSQASTTRNTGGDGDGGTGRQDQPSSEAEAPPAPPVAVPEQPEGPADDGTPTGPDQDRPTSGGPTAGAPATDQPAAEPADKPAGTPAAEPEPSSPAAPPAGADPAPAEPPAAAPEPPHQPTAPAEPAPPAPVWARNDQPGGPQGAPPPPPPAAPPAQPSGPPGQPPGQAAFSTPPTGPALVTPTEVTASAVVPPPGQHPGQPHHPVQRQQPAGPPTGHAQVVPPPYAAAPVPQQQAQAGPGGVPRRDRLREALRPPEGSRKPRMRALVGASAWALVLCLGGVVVGIWSLVKILAGGPGWFEPTIVIVGLLGLILTIAAFPTLERRIVPWTLLGAGTLMLIAGTVIAATA